MSLYAVQVTGEAIAASTAETILMVVAGSSKRVKVRRWGISFNGVDVTDAAVQVQLMRFSSNGTSSSSTPTKLDESEVASLAAVRTAFSAEPTTGDIIESHFVTPAGGNLVEVYYDDAPVVGVNGRIGIRVLAADAVNVSGFLVFEE